MANVKENSPEAIAHIRSTISKIAEDGKFYLLDGSYGIKLLDAGKFEILTDCFIYIFGEYKPIWEIGKRVMENILPENKINQPEPLALAVYGSSKCFKEIKHVGIFNQNLAVVSKWGLSPVFEHPLESVPEVYGQQVEYFRINIDKISKLCHPSLIQFLNLETSLPLSRRQKSKTLN